MEDILRYKWLCLDRMVAPDVAGSAHKRYDALIRQLGIQVVGPGRKAGDASIHSGQTLHSVLPNTSDEPRAVMTLVFFVDGLMTDNMPYSFHPTRILLVVSTCKARYTGTVWRTC